jgi:co-chaperonin GroES (HSP10)
VAKKTTLRTAARSKCDLRPWGNRIAVEVEGQVQKTRGGIHLPDRLTDDKDMMIGEIVATGEGPMHEGEALPYDGPEIGTRIMFNVNQSVAVEYDGRKYQVLSVPSILNVLPAK